MKPDWTFLTEVDCQHTGTYVCSSVTDIGTVMQVAKGCTINMDTREWKILDSMILLRDGPKQPWFQSTCLALHCMEPPIGTLEVVPICIVIGQAGVSPLNLKLLGFFYNVCMYM